MEHSFGSIFREEPFPKIITSILNSNDLRAEYPFISVIKHPYEPLENGFPSQRGLDENHKLLDNLAAALLQNTAVYVGHATGGGVVHYVFCSKRALPSEIRIKVGLFKTKDFKIDVQHDPEWKIFGSILGVTEIEFEQFQFEDLIEHLKKQGDDFTKVRTVDFAATFQSALQRDKFVSEVTAIGFAVLPFTDEEREDKGTYWCECTRDTNLIPADFFPLCAQFRKLCIKFEGFFDGWATPLGK